ncbi:MAG: hypothetical protein ACE5NG_16335 [bacterium]
MSRRLRADWQAYYGREVVLLETFVERTRFLGCLLSGSQLDLCGPNPGPGA